MPPAFGPAGACLGVPKRTLSRDPIEGTVDSRLPDLPLSFVLSMLSYCYTVHSLLSSNLAALQALSVSSMHDASTSLLAMSATAGPPRAYMLACAAHESKGLCALRIAYEEFRSYPCFASVSEAQNQ